MALIKQLGDGLRRWATRNDLGAGTDGRLVIVHGELASRVRIVVVLTVTVGGAAAAIAGPADPAQSCI